MPLDVRSIDALGDSAVVVQFEQQIDHAIHQQVIALQRALEAEALSAVTFITPAYCSLGIGLDPLQISITAFRERVRVLAANTDPASEAASVREWTIPVCYDEDLGWDLATVANQTGMTIEEVIAAHLSTGYQVFMLGFLPGFAYLGTLPPELALPRRAVARTAVPAGAVAIAERQTAIYPVASPGGWHVLGRTPFKPFDVASSEPFRFRVGDRVTFQRISYASFAQWHD